VTPQRADGSTEGTADEGGIAWTVLGGRFKALVLLRQHCRKKNEIFIGVQAPYKRYFAGTRKSVWN
jgi:hypothetical protein